MSKTIYQKVGIASVIMMGSVFLSRGIGLFREMVIAYVAGAGAAVDAYQVAFVIPEILNHIVASGFLSVTFIPIFSRYLAQGREEDGWRTFSVILNSFGSLLLALIGVASIFTNEFVSLIAPGLKDPQHVAEAVRMTRIILPAQFFFFVGGLFMAVQFSKERFAIPALAPLIYNLGIITGGLVLGPGLGMEGFSWGVLAGAFVGNCAIQYWGAKRVGFRYFPMFDFRHPDLKKYLKLTLPLMLGLTMMFSSEFFLKFFGSFLPRGGIAALNYGLRVMLILVGIFGQAVGIASFPFMARLAAENRMDEMNQLIDRALRYLALVIPFSALLIVLRREVIMILFERGQFDAAATALTSHILIFLLIGASAFAAQTVVVRGYYATQNTLFPALFGSAAVILTIPLYMAGIRLMGASGVALAMSVSAIFQVALLYVLWNRKSGNPHGAVVYYAYLRMVVLSVFLGVAIEWLKIHVLGFVSPASVSESLMFCVVTGIAFAVILLLTGYLLNIPEILEFSRHLIRRKEQGNNG